MVPLLVCVKLILWMDSGEEVSFCQFFPRYFTSFFHLLLKAYFAYSLLEVRVSLPNTSSAILAFRETDRNFHGYSNHRRWIFKQMVYTIYTLFKFLPC